MRFLISLFIMIVTLKAAAMELKIATQHQNSVIQAVKINCFDMTISKSSSGHSRVLRYDFDLEKIKNNSYELPLANIINNDCDLRTITVNAKVIENQTPQLYFYTADLTDTYMLEMIESSKVYLSSYDQKVSLESDNLGDKILAGLKSIIPQK